MDKLDLSNLAHLSLLPITVAKVYDLHFPLKNTFLNVINVSHTHESLKSSHILPVA